MQPPSRWLAPGAGTAMPPPPPAVRRRRQGTRGPPPLSHPLPLRPKSGRRQTEETAAPHPPRRGRCTRGAGAPRPGQAPTRPACCRPTADRRRPGRRKRSGLIRGRPGEDGGANQGGGVPPPPPPPRRTDPLAADRTAPDARGRPATPTARAYPGGARQGQRKGGQRPTGRGGGGAAPPAPPHPPPAWEPQERPSAPPEPRGPPPPEGTATRGGGGGCGWTCSRGGRGPRASPHQRARATRAPEQYGGRAPHDSPVTTAQSGRAEGGFRSAGAPRGVVHGPPFTPPHCSRARPSGPCGWLIDLRRIPFDCRGWSPVDPFWLR